MANQIMVIKPYKWEGMWVFDDADVGLEREVFLAGADQMIDTGIKRKGIEEAEKGFMLIFSRDWFPGADMELNWVRREGGGNVYVWEGMEGWLCPALFKYFEKAPEKIFVQMKQKS